VDVDAAGDRAAATGHWRGGGVGGGDMAAWRKITGQWVIESELFVTLG